MLFGQQTLELDKVLMGSFTDGDTECYNLVITEPGAYMVTYNLMDATVTLTNSANQTLYTDYMSFFGSEPKEELITLENAETYKVCFSKNGATSMYQIKIKKANGSGEVKALTYGDYILEQVVLDDTKIDYSFQGKTSEKIQIGFSGGFSGNLKITSPNNTVLFEQSYETPPNDGLILDFVLSESGEYQIEVSPLFSTTPYTISLYLIEPVTPKHIELHTTYGDVIANRGVKYYRFYACADDSLQFNYHGATEYVSVDITSPSGTVINCNNCIDEIHLAHTLYINQEGFYIITIKSSLQGFLTYDFSLEIRSEDYEPGTLIIEDIAYMYKKVYSFEASENDLLRIGLDLPLKYVELEDPDGSIVLKMDSSSHNQIRNDVFREILLTKTGQYVICIWHKSHINTPEIMKFCASIVPGSSEIIKDSVYSITVPPFQRIPLTFSMDKGEVIRSGLPDGTVLTKQESETLEINYGETYLESINTTVSLNLVNTNTESTHPDFWIKTVVPPLNASPLEIGGTFSTTIENFESPGVIFSGTENDTVCIQAQVTELITSPDENNTLPSVTWFYLTYPDGITTRQLFKTVGSIEKNGYNITYSTQRNIVLLERGEYCFTIAFDKEVTENISNCEIKIKHGIEDTEIPFGIETTYDVPGNYNCTIPNGLEKLFVIVKKKTHSDYDNTWKGSVPLKHHLQTWQSTVGKDLNTDDFTFMIPNPDEGMYTLPVFAEYLNDETRGSVLFTDKLAQIPMNEWSTGIITRPYGNDWKTISLDQAADTLFLESEGYGLWSRIEIFNAELVHVKTIDNMGKGYHIRGTMLNVSAGIYYIRYVDSAVLYDHKNNPSNKSYKADQSRKYLLYAGTSELNTPDKLSLRRVSSVKLGKKQASLTLYGSGFGTDNQVSLIATNGQSNISLDVYHTNNDGDELLAGKDFTNAIPGLYRLKVVNTDTTVYYNSFIKILQDVRYSIRSSLMTSNLYRAGRYQKCIIRITNNGNADIPYAAGYIYTSSEQANTFITDVPETSNNIDSSNWVIVGTTFNKMPFFIENLQVGKTVEFVFEIYSSTLQTNDSFDVGYKLGIFDESVYYSIRNEMATLWYNFLLAFDETPESMKYYLEQLSLNGFIDLWNGELINQFKSRSMTNWNNERRERLDTGIDIVIKILDFCAGKTLPFSDRFSDVSKVIDICSNPWSFAKAAVSEIWDIAKKISEALDGGLSDVLTGDEEEGEENSDEEPYTRYNEEKMKKFVVNSTTPEDKYGPVGYGMEHGNGYISNIDQFEYRIDYWNKEDATAPAAIVYIRDTIDTEFDLTTLKFTELGFLKWKVNLDGGQHFNINIDCRPDMPYIVNVKGKVDHETREVYWAHTTLDPASMELPEDPMSGYLPPIDSSAYQMGWVNYTIQPLTNLPHETSFENQAFVNFDGVGKWGPAPPYGPYTNILDLNPPWSYIESLDAVQPTLTFDVKLHGTDLESGIKHTRVYVSKDYTEASFWKSTRDTILSFNGENGSIYRFYSLATDNAGNNEALKWNYETSTEINLISTGFEIPSRINANKMRIVPNPNRGIFKILFEDIQKGGLLEIISLSGEKVHVDYYIPGQTLDLNHLKNGVYIVKFNNRINLSISKVSIL